MEQAEQGQGHSMNGWERRAVGFDFTLPIDDWPKARQVSQRAETGFSGRLALIRRAAIVGRFLGHVFSPISIGSGGRGEQFTGGWVDPIALMPHATAGLIDHRRPTRHDMKESPKLTDQHTPGFGRQR